MSIFSLVSVGSLSVPKCTFPTPNSIEFGAGKVHFGFAFAECRGLVVVLRTWREEPAKPPPALHHNYDFATADFALAAVSRVACPDTPKAWKVSLRVRNEPLVCAGVLSKERRQRMQIVHRTEARADQLAIVCRDVGGV